MQGCCTCTGHTASGAQTEQEGLAEALDYVRAGDTLVVWKLDRLAVAFGDTPLNVDVGLGAMPRQRDPSRNDADKNRGAGANNGRQWPELLGVCEVPVQQVVERHLITAFRQTATVVA